MKAMIMEETQDLCCTSHPLKLAEYPTPAPGEGQVLIKVSACGVCHTEIDVIEGRTSPRLPVVLGHQVVGRIVEHGPGTGRFEKGTRVGVAWIFNACGECDFCRSGQENLCADFMATGCHADGGYAEYMVAYEDFIYPIPRAFSDAKAAPLMCAGAIGYRSLHLTGITNGRTLGFVGFGASAHLVLKMAKKRFPDTAVFVYARSAKERAFAEELGAAWAGDYNDDPPEQLDAVIDTTPAWRPVLKALEVLKPGGRLVINAVRKEDADRDLLMGMDYPRHLWLEKEIKSVANVTRRDVSDFLELAAEMNIDPVVEEYGLKDANRALMELKSRKIHGAKVLIMD